MSDGSSRTPMSPVRRELSALEHENGKLRQENERLQRQTRSVAEANAHAAELMVRLEEAHDVLKREVERRRQVEDELRQANREMEDRVQARTVELASANERLALHRRELQQVLDSAVAQIWYMDIEGRVVNCNSVACKVSGVSLNEARGKTIRMLAPTWDDPERRHQESLAVARTGQPQLGSIESFRAGEEVRWASVDKVPWRDANGAVIGVLLFVYDITDRKRAEQLQTQLLQRLSQTNEELSHFAYVVSHDLKAPLRGIKLITEWLCEDYVDKLDDEGKEQMTLLQSRVNRMHNLIDGVLQYSRVGRVKEDMVELDLNELMPIILDTIAPPAHIQIAVEPDLPTVTCEKTRLTQVFQNLLSNAVKFMDKPQGKIHVGCVEEGDFWKLSVADNGPGIEAKHFERIFRIFQTLAPKDDYESTGVGLTLVKKIVELYGGRVWIESEVGKGSTFFFTLPKQTGAID
jgi:two-component system, LuxR family, sensor kinase FixL